MGKARSVPTAADFERMLRKVALRVTCPRVAALSAVHDHLHAGTDSITGSSARTSVSRPARLSTTCRAHLPPRLARRGRPAPRGRPHPPTSPPGAPPTAPRRGLRPGGQGQPPPPPAPVVRCRRWGDRRYALPDRVRGPRLHHRQIEVIYCANVPSVLRPPLASPAAEPTSTAISQKKNSEP